MTDFTEYLATTSVDIIVQNRDADFIAYVRSYKLKCSGTISKICNRAIQENDPTYLVYLLDLLDFEDFMYFTNCNAVVVKSVKGGCVNIVEYMNSISPITEVMSFKTAAASSGNLTMLKFLHTLNPSWFSEAYECAQYFYNLVEDKYRYEGVLNFIKENGGIVNKTKATEEANMCQQDLHMQQFEKEETDQE